MQATGNIVKPIVIVTFWLLAITISFGGASSECSTQIIQLQPGQTRALTLNVTHALLPPVDACHWSFMVPPNNRILIRTVSIRLRPGLTFTISEGEQLNTSRTIWRREGGTAPSYALSRGDAIFVVLERVSNFGDGTDLHVTLELSVFEGPVNCLAANQFACRDGYQCIDAQYVCDDIVHCWDFSDEMACSDLCSDTTALLCDDPELVNISCLTREVFCDGVADCFDYRDETFCANACGDERYINLEDYPNSKYTLSIGDNGIPPQTDCLWVFTAKPGNRVRIESIVHVTPYLSVMYLFNGAGPRQTGRIIQTILATSPPFVLVSKNNSAWAILTLPQTSKDISSSALLYSFTSVNGSETCGESLYECTTSGNCINAENVCDGHFTCDDFTDETGCDHCGGISVINVTDNQPFTLQMEYAIDRVNFRNGRSCVWYVSATTGFLIQVTVKEFALSPANNLFFGDGRVDIYSSWARSFSSSYSQLSTTSRNNTMWITFLSLDSYENRFILEIQQFEPTDCEDDEFACSSGLACIPIEERCDGFPQCPLKSDEIQCGSCASHEFACSSKQDKCVDESSDICNGKMDCPTAYDEMDCYPCGESRLLLPNIPAPPTVITSPNFPLHYPDSSTCLWLITASEPATKIRFKFTAFSLQSVLDNVTLGNGLDPSNSSSRIIVLTGALRNVSVVSKANTAWMLFQSDTSISGMGFEVHISYLSSRVVASCSQDKFQCENRSVGLICGNTSVLCDGRKFCPDGSDEQSCGMCGAKKLYIDEEPLLLSSPNYPYPYPDDLNCSWEVIPPQHFWSVMRIKDFAMEYNFDFLIVTTGAALHEPGTSVLLNLTGEDVPDRTLSWGPEKKVWLTLTTDLATSRSLRGFSLILFSFKMETGFRQKGFERFCTDDEFHCGDGMCITNTSVCNGHIDCKNYKDETDCSEIHCPGSYQCDNINIGSPSPIATTPLPLPLFPSPSLASPDQSKNPNILTKAQCIQKRQVCDGKPDCPIKDDEIQCDIKRCPARCECSYQGIHLIVTCRDGWNASTLSELALTTHSLQLSGKNISKLDKGFFKVASHLKVLSLKNNSISEIQERTFAGLGKLLWLDLSNTSLDELKDSAMKELKSLQGITMFNIPLKRIKTRAFAGLGQVKTLILVRNIKNLPPLMIENKAFEGLDNLTEMYVDDHRLCCLVGKNTVCKTLEPEPPLFMCSQLMPQIIHKVSMWILGLSALIGNIFVMVWRCREKTEGKSSRIVHSFLVFNLAVSDALMGLYMLIIAGTDIHYGAQYFENSSEWRMSVMCRIAGFISIIASEASVFFLTIISIDRFLSIVFPFSRYHFRPKSARIAAASTWLVTAIVALVPTLLSSNAESDLYGLSDVCIGLPLMTKVTKYDLREQTINAQGVTKITVQIPYPEETQASWFYSIALFLGVNLLCFTAIFVCYIAIFVKVKLSVRRVRRHKKRDDEIRLAVKMAAIVATDFVCWVPVIVMGILSQAQIVKIPTKAYAWIVVFILPINSSLNPYLYTFSDICCRPRQQMSTKNEKELAVKSTNSENYASTLTNLSTDSGKKSDQ